MPVNFYFVKSCVFILVLSLTRNVSYFTDKVPDGFLATSTTLTQYVIQWFIKEKILKDDKGKDDSQKASTTQDIILHNVINEYRKKHNQEDDNQETVAHGILRNIIGEFLKNMEDKNENV